MVYFCLLQNEEPSQAGIGMCIPSFIFCKNGLTLGLYFTEGKHQQDPDDDSGVGPSVSTDRKSTTSFEVSY